MPALPRAFGALRHGERVCRDLNDAHACFPIVMAGLVPRLSGSDRLDMVHGVDSSAVLSIAK
ncbi:hypothetical protein ACQR2C_13800, partial [Bradyrhizobium sp. HKCCYLRH3061]